MSETIIVGEVSPELMQQAQNLHALAAGYVITCPELREAASEDLRQVKALFKQLDEQEKSITRPINEGLKRVRRDMFRRPKAWLEQAEDVLKRAMLSYDRVVEQARLAAQAEANRLADIERKRLEEAAAREAAAGNVETAQAIKEAAAMTAPVPVVSEAPKIAGESHREVWHAAILDEALIPREYLVPDMQKLNASARMFKGALAISGVRAVCEKILASRSA